MHNAARNYDLTALYKTRWAPTNIFRQHLPNITHKHT